MATLQAVKKDHWTTHLAADVVNHANQLANEELFERILERIHRYFLKLLRDEHEADECLQETLMVLARSLREGKYDASKSFNTWIWIKARSIYAQYWRRRAKRPRTLPEHVAAPGSPVDDPSARADAAAVLEEVRRRLGEEAYEAFVLYYEGGLNKGEVAEVLGRDPKTVRKRISEAHALIEKLLA
ncbi:MAG: sigma-70 family RNA polymerase sigma factor [Planctomycetota bacterium]|nr:MAG: sigma-70 family RNA polymerase sigma factor [Planctomycetota bacterium]